MADFTPADQTDRVDPVERMAGIRHEFGEHGGVNRSIEASTTFTVMEAGHMPEIFGGKRGPDMGHYLYGRHFNPTVYTLGRDLAALEGTEAGYAVSSGMAAISCTLHQLCRPGDHVVAGNVLYGGTYALLKNYLPAKADVHTSMVPISDLDAVERAFTPRTRVLYCETMANPTLVVADLPRLAEIARRHDVPLVVDNTFCPLIVNPAAHGAAIVLHSMTKYLSGGSDIIAGAICGPKRFIGDLMNVNDGAVMLLGPTMDPKVAFDLSLRLPHLPLRITEHSRRALTFAQRLEEHGVPVIYPGLPSHPQHEVLRRIGNPAYGAGGLFGIDLGTTRRAFEFMEILQNKDRFGYMAVSLGYFDTLMSCSAKTTSSEMTEADQRAGGLRPGLVRVSLGYTGTLEQRWSQFEDALRVFGLVR